MLAVILAFFGVGLTAPAASAAQPPESGNRPARSEPAWDVSVVLTTGNLRSRLAAQPPLQFQPVPLARGAQVINVDDTKRYQQIWGFGAAMTDTSAWLIYDQLPVSSRVYVMNALFGRHGLGLNFLRLPIGASDFTALGRPYSYDDLPPGETDPDLVDFSIAHDEAYIIPALQEMLAINPAVEILASPWSPPPWMKANGQFNNAGYRGSLLPQYYGTAAAYYVKFIQAYAQLGVPVAGITTQNEPQAPSPYPGMKFTAAQEAQWVDQDLAPAIAAAGLRTRIYGYDGGRSGYPLGLLTSPALHDLTGLAWHCYGGLGVMNYLHYKYPALDQLVSECSPGLAHFSVPEILIDAARNWASRVALWNLALDPQGGPVEAPNWGCKGCVGLVRINPTTHNLRLNLSYYQLGQVTEFVRPGATRVDSNNFVTYFHAPSGNYGATDGLDDVAFVNRDGSHVLVVYNNSSDQASFAVQWQGVNFPYTLRGRGTVTFVWNTSGSGSAGLAREHARSAGAASP